MTSNETTHHPTHRVYAVRKTGGDKALDGNRRGLGQPGRQRLQSQALFLPIDGADIVMREAKAEGGAK